MVGAALSFVLGYTGLRIRAAEEKAMFLTPVEIGFIAVFSALTAMVTGSTGFEGKLERHGRVQDEGRRKQR
ncbi:MAG: hypothetical protein ABSA11_16780 [Candidatus Bathyarchaeia archaeon]